MAAQEIIQTQDITEVRKIVSTLKRSPQWDNKKKNETMILANTEKYTQHQDLKDRLKQTKGVIISCNYDSYWSAGMVLTQKNYINSATIPGRNILGKIIQDIRDAV